MDQLHKSYKGRMVAVEIKNEPPVCPKCFSIMNPIWENNGWDGIEGPRMDEITGYQCLMCGETK